MHDYNLSVIIYNLKNDKSTEVLLPVTEQTLKEYLQLDGFNDKNLYISSCGRGAGQDIKKLIDAKISQKAVDIKLLNQIGEIVKKSDIDRLCALNGLIEIAKVKTPQDIIKIDKTLDKYKMIFYGSEQRKETLGYHLYNHFKSKVPAYKRSVEYIENIVDDFHKISKGHFTKYGYLVKDFDKIKAKCTNKGLIKDVEKMKDEAIHE